MHSSIEIARRFLELARPENRTITPMQLLKLVYIAHGWSLGLYQRPLIRDDIQAWKYGPVIPDLYNRIRRYGSGPVNDLMPSGSHAPLTPIEEDLIRQVYNIYGKRSGVALSRITHAPGTPWTQMYNRGVFNTPIPNDVIQEHYSSLIARAAQN
jgi:uncharacterized phage-associated protein